MRFSRRLALVIGILAPLLDTIRRWHTWRTNPPALIDDYLLGALLLGGVWLSSRDSRRGHLLLAAGWGCAAAGFHTSFFGQVSNLRAGILDPAPIPSEWVAAIKGAGLLLAMVALGLTVSAKDP